MVPFAIFLFFLIPLLFIPSESEASKLVFLFLIVLFSLVLLNLYQLKFSVFQDQLEVKFGQGFLKKKIAIKDIDLGSFAEIKLPWYYGLGWKYDLKGHEFFSAKPGIALSFKLNGNAKQYRSVAKDNQALKEAIIKAAE